VRQGDEADCSYIISRGHCQVVKERDVFTRERDVNLLDLPYLGSKATVLGILGVLQMIVMYGICNVFCGIPGDPYQQFLVLNLAILNGMGLGLLISSLSKSTDMAATIVPIVLIPQVIFAGALGTLDGAAKWVAELAIVNHWAYEGLKATLPTELTDLQGKARGHFRNPLGTFGDNDELNHGNNNKNHDTDNEIATGHKTAKCIDNIAGIGFK